MKILISAYACEPRQGSEEGVGWNLALAIAKFHRVCVLTRSFYRPAIELELSLHPNSNLEFVYFEPFGWSDDWRGKQGAVQFHYYLWQVQAYFKALNLDKKAGFDLIHHVTYVKYWSPSFLSLLPIPFIWGPVGGGESAPKSFWRDFGLRGQVYECLRHIAQRLGELDPFTRITAKRCSVALATTPETEKRIRLLRPQALQIVSQVALSSVEIQDFSNLPFPPPKPIRFVSIGRLLHWKGIHLGLRGFAIANLKDAEYWVIGDGPERQRLEELAVESGIIDQVRFLGKVTRDSISFYLEQCHILVHPSLHDSGGQVCLEMMAAGRPVICLDLGGPAVQVAFDTGIKVPALNPEQAAGDLAKAMVQLASNADLLTEMGRAGQRRVKEHFAWDVKGRYFSDLYQKVLGPAHFAEDEQKSSWFCK